MNLPLRTAVALAARSVTRSWPLDSFIAINPIADLENIPFDDVPATLRTTRPVEAYRADFRSGRITFADLESAIRERIPEFDSPARATIGGVTVLPATLIAYDLTLPALSPSPTSTSSPVSTDTGSRTSRDADLSARLDRLTTKWLAAFLDPDPLWRMPASGEGLFGAFRRLARYDPDLTRRQRRSIAALPQNADDALAASLVELGVTAERQADVLRDELAQLPGWVAHLKWRADQLGDVDLTSYLAVRLSLRAAISAPLATPSERAEALPPARSPFENATIRAAEILRALLSDGPVEDGDVATVRGILAAHPPADHVLTWQRAYEIHYRDALLESIRADDGRDRDVDGRAPTTQVLFCIDPRSEGMRRHLETHPSVETFGAAGFFGVPIRFVRYGARGRIDALPALLSPRHAATEHPVDARRAARRTAGLRLHSALSAAVHSSENSVLTPFAFAEASGLLYGVATVLRTLAPTTTARLRRRVAEAFAPRIASTITIADAFTIDERVALAETLLRMTGLRHFAPLVILTGHGSTTTNNLYESALQCGACGGNPGDANARSAAAIFNDPEVRARLAARGTVIPDDTVFVAAEHDTTLDTVEILDRHHLPDHCRALVTEFDRLQREAGEALLRERAGQLPGASARHRPARIRRRAHDWAEVYPEWGLTGNAAMIVGPRAMTRGVDLQRRVFLHSYEAAADPDGAGLESILTAPVVVAQWISHQYYFSSIDPERWGAGTKTLHNAIGALGVLAGGSGDLRQGLPWQSVGFGRHLVHEPMRLTVVVEAPLERIGEIVSRNQVLRHLFDNAWLTLTARSTPLDPWNRYTPYGWRPWSGPHTEGASS
jgi:uncharacterized protein YbcC (UPF0753/DUF2309 family)